MFYEPGSEIAILGWKCLKFKLFGGVQSLSLVDKSEFCDMIYRIDSILISNITKSKLRVKLSKSKTVYLLPIVVGGGVGGFYVEYIDSKSHNISTTEYFM